MTNEARKGTTWETTDMSVAAWLLANKVRILAVRALPERRREFRFTFDDDEGKCEPLSLSYLSSEAYAFDTAMRSLKKMCFGPGAQARTSNHSRGNGRR
jgi:hypothetical protein